jgi:hypothetical protein
MELIQSYPNAEKVLSNSDSLPAWVSALNIWQAPKLGQKVLPKKKTKKKTLLLRLLMWCVMFLKIFCWIGEDCWDPPISSWSSWLSPHKTVQRNDPSTADTETHSRGSRLSCAPQRYSSPSPLSCQNDVLNHRNWAGIGTHACNAGYMGGRDGGLWSEASPIQNQRPYL